jgi:hypothetical protein
MLKYGFLLVCFAGVAGCSVAPSRQVTIQAASLLPQESARDVLPPTMAMDPNSIGRSNITAVSIRGDYMRWILSHGINIRVFYVDCQRGSELATSMGPFFDRDHFDSSTNASAIDEHTIYVLNGTIPTDLIGRSVCVRLSGSNFVGRQVNSNTVPLVVVSQN